jgi:hypothetical protein
MKDYYKILGLYNDASEDQIHKRYSELSRTFHALQLQPGGDERIKEINEAYEALKDPATRFDYDFERDLKKSVHTKLEYEKRKRKSRLKIIIPASAIGVFLSGAVLIFILSKPQGPPLKVERRPIVPPKTEASVQVGKEPQTTIPAKPADQAVATAIPKPPEPAPPPPSKEALPAVSVPPVSKRAEPAPVEKKVAKEPAKKETVALAPALREEKAKAAPPPVVSKPAEPVRVAQRVAPEPEKREVPASAPVPRQMPPPPAAPRPEVEARKVEVPPVEKIAPREVSADPSPKTTPAEPVRIAPVVPVPPPPLPQAVESAKPAVETSKEASKEIPPEKPSIAPKEVAKTEAPKPSPSGTPQAVVPLVVAPAPKPEEPAKMARDIPKEINTAPIAKEEEVRQFFARYMAQLNAKNVEGFMSLFSLQAVQNQKTRYNGLKKMYAKFFEDSQKLNYQIQPGTIDISPQDVFVQGTYSIEQEVKGGQVKMWKGNIEWTLVREKGALKVLTLQYQHSQAP